MAVVEGEVLPVADGDITANASRRFRGDLTVVVEADLGGPEVDIAGTTEGVLAGGGEDAVVEPDGLGDNVDGVGVACGGAAGGGCTAVLSEELIGSCCNFSGLAASGGFSQESAVAVEINEFGGDNIEITCIPGTTGFDTNLTVVGDGELASGDADVAAFTGR